MSISVAQLEYEARQCAYYKGKVEAYEKILRAAGILSEIKPVEFHVESIQPHK